MNDESSANLLTAALAFSVHLQCLDDGIVHFFSWSVRLKIPAQQLAGDTVLLFLVALPLLHDRKDGLGGELAFGGELLHFQGLR